MKTLLPALVAVALLLAVVYAIAATGALTDRPLAVLGALLIGVGLVRRHTEVAAPATVRNRSPRTRD